jgi:hypothetical protein
VRAVAGISKDAGEGPVLGCVIQRDTAAVSWATVEGLRVSLKLMLGEILSGNRAGRDRRAYSDLLLLGKHREVFKDGIVHMTEVPDVRDCFNRRIRKE